METIIFKVFFIVLVCTIIFFTSLDIKESKEDKKENQKQKK
jgi:hypothetical protein